MKKVSKNSTYALNYVVAAALKSARTQRVFRDFFCTVFILLAVSGCQAGPPWASWMFEGPPEKEGVEYPPLYVKGWQDGCESGTSATANHWYKFNYSFTQDWKLAQNRVYYKGWKDAFDYCQRYIYQYYRRGFL